MSKRGSGNLSRTYVERFAAVYNDKVKFPAMIDVAGELGMSYQSVRNRASEIRRQYRGEICPLRSRAVGLKTVEKAVDTKSPGEHAEHRAKGIQDAVQGLFQASNYPVVNPEALVIQRATSRRYDPLLGDYVETQAAPRTWLTDTLRVEGRKDVRNRTYIFTGAQNDAELHAGFWENLEAYAEELDAEIVVGPWTYETNWWDENNPLARDYDDRIMPHLCFGQMELGDNFVFCGEMNTLPTSPRPIADLTSYSCGRWAVFPHARLQLLSVPSTDSREQAHHVMTTGAVTRPKVIPRKAGIKSIFHHIIGATLVEFDKDGDVFCRQINASSDGSFYDLDAFVEGGVVNYGNAVRAVTCADLHVAKLGNKNAFATFGFDYRSMAQQSGSVLEALQPQHIFLEDIHDQESRSHHREKDVSHDYEMAVRNRESVEGEVKRSAAFLEQLTRAYLNSTVHVVESNHDVALERYVREGRYRLDGINFAYGLKLDAAYHEWRKQVANDLDLERRPPKFSLLEWAIRDTSATSLPVHWIYDGNDSFVLDGIECGHHGHRGTNGAHGSAAGFARLGRKMSIGDKHSPQILDGVFVAGVMELQHGYNKGPSGWSVTHIVQYQNGKRSLVTLQNGKWRADRS